MPVVQQRRGLKVDLDASVEIPASGQIIYETDNNCFKVGNGTDTYVNLPYLAAAGGSVITEHLADAAITAIKVATDAVGTDTIIDANVTTPKIADDAVTYGKIQDVTAGDRLLGRVGGPGPVQEIQCTQLARHLLNDSTEEQMRQTIHAASLDSSGKIPASELPSYVDDVLEYATQAGFPATGETGKIYVDLSTGNIFRWGGSAYIQISNNIVTTDDLAEGSTNLYYTDTRVTTQVGNLDTDSLSEGSTNLYFTNARAQSAVGTNYAALSGATFTGIVKVPVSSGSSIPQYSFDLTGLGNNSSDRVAGLYMSNYDELTCKLRDEEVLLVEHEGTAGTDTVETNLKVPNVSTTNNEAQSVEFGHAKVTSRGNDIPSASLPISNMQRTTTLSDANFASLKFHTEFEAGNGALVFGCGQDYVFGVGTEDSSGHRTEALRITREGKVGVGETEPIADLHVDGTLKVTGNVTFDTGLPVGYINNGSGAGDRIIVTKGSGSGCEFVTPHYGPLDQAISLPVGDLAQSSATTGQVIKWDGTSWVASDESGGSGGSGSSTLSGLTDVTVSGPTSGQGLVYNGSAWVNDSIHDALPDGSAGSPSLAFANDTDTGFFRGTANYVSVATDGWERFRFGTSGYATSHFQFKFSSTLTGSNSMVLAGTETVYPSITVVGADSDGIGFHNTHGVFVARNNKGVMWFKDDHVRTPPQVKVDIDGELECDGTVDFTGATLQLDDNQIELTKLASGGASGTDKVLKYNSTSGVWEASTLDYGHLANKPASFTPAAHNQAISTITGLQSALDAKASQGSLDVTNASLSDAVAEMVSQDTCPAVVLSGSYNDLLNKPDLNQYDLRLSTLAGQHTLSGGGLVTWTPSGTSAGDVKWSDRVIANPVENAEVGSDGFISMYMPAAGTTVTHLTNSGTTSTKSVTADGIRLAAWEALYYNHTSGGNHSTTNNRYTVVHRSNTNFDPEDGWILICVNNSDQDKSDGLKWLPGQFTIPQYGGQHDALHGTMSWLNEKRERLTVSDDNVSGTLTLPLTQAKLFEVDIDQGFTLAFQNLSAWRAGYYMEEDGDGNPTTEPLDGPGEGLGISCTTVLKWAVTSGSTAGDAANYAITFPTNIKWPGGQAPSLTSIMGKEDILTFLTTNGGLTWYGFVAGQNF
jgi:hypothetical protein